MVTESTARPETETGEAMASAVKEAWAATSQLGDGVDPATREAAFKLVLESMLIRGESKFVAEELPPEDRDEYEVHQIDDADLFSTPQLRTSEIAAYLRISGRAADALYNVCSREPRLKASTQLLSESNENAVCEIGLLTVAGRIAVGVETTLRDVCDSLNGSRIPNAETLVSNLLTRGYAEHCFVEQYEDGVLRLTGEGVLAVRELAQRLTTS